MLWCETAGAEPLHLENLAVFVNQLAARDVPACIDAKAIPHGLARNAQFDLAPALRDGKPADDDTVVVLAAQRLTDQGLVALRRLAGPAPRRCIAFGSFATRQKSIGTTARLSYIFGRDPLVVDLAADGAALAPGDAPVFGAIRRTSPAGPPRLLVVGPALTDGRQAAALAALALTRDLKMAVLTDGKAKQQWVAAHGKDIALYHYGEVLPAGLAERVDLCITFVPPGHNYRLKCLIANLAVSGATLLDGTPGHELARASDAFVRAPQDLSALALSLRSDILANLGAIGAQVRTSAFARRVGTTALDWLPDAPAPVGGRDRAGPKAPAGRPERIVFMPTNGVGLGHAQRCALLAAELDRGRLEPVFAAFPSCMRLVKTYGFDVMPLVARSALHEQKHENDLVNFLRLRALCRDASTLVFDGGYVFDSVYRTVLEGGLHGIWIRRGLWQAGQDNALALDREKAFSRVIVPMEAFAELNRPYSLGDHVLATGPIVQRVELGAAERSAVRARLAERYGIVFERLVVTQLGAGVAADRGGQIQALCGMMERRPGVLHLVVVWPTSALQPAWFAWTRTRVVKTHHAGVLAAAADLCISAAGYNSFHESLYNRYPTIFVPQMSAFMDDQRARARAARDRGLAAVVEADELVTLEREIARHLDDGEAEALRGRLAGLDLPAIGNRQAAEAIEEMTDGEPTLERAAVADRPAGRR